jgi:hypothetical protein
MELSLMKKNRNDEIISLLTSINNHLAAIEAKLSSPAQKQEPEQGTDWSNPDLISGMLAVTQAASKPSSFGHLA